MHHPFAGLCCKCKCFPNTADDLTCEYVKWLLHSGVGWRYINCVELWWGWVTKIWAGGGGTGTQRMGAVESIRTRLIVAIERVTDCVLERYIGMVVEFSSSWVAALLQCVVLFCSTWTGAGLENMCRGFYILPGCWIAVPGWLSGCSTWVGVRLQHLGGRRIAVRTWVGVGLWWRWVVLKPVSFLFLLQIRISCCIRPCRDTPGNHQLLLWYAFAYKQTWRHNMYCFGWYEVGLAYWQLTYSLLAHDCPFVYSA